MTTLDVKSAAVVSGQLGEVTAPLDDDSFPIYRGAAGSQVIGWVSRLNAWGAFLKLSGGTMTGDINFNGAKIIAAVQNLANQQITASRSLTIADAQQKMLVCNHASTPIVITIPTNASVAGFGVGTVININQWGAAAVSVTAAGGVTINKPSDRSLVCRRQYCVFSIWKESTDTWQAFGDLT